MMDSEAALNEIEKLLAEGKRVEAMEILMQRYADGFHDGKVVQGFKGAKI